MSNAARHSRRHYRLLSNGGPDLPGDAGRRVLARSAACRGVADREARYPILTADNALEALAYQSERIRFYLVPAGGGEK